MKGYVCDKCGKSFSSVEYLSFHKQNTCPGKPTVAYESTVKKLKNKKK